MFVIRLAPVQLSEPARPVRIAGRALPCPARQSASLSSLRARSLAGFGFVSWLAGVAMFWLLGGQAEEGGEQGRVGLPDQRPDKHWGPAHDQAAAEASELASVSGARTGDALAGGGGATCLLPVSAVLRSGA